MRVPSAVPATARAGRINRERPIVIEFNCSWRLERCQLGSLKFFESDGGRWKWMKLSTER